MIETISSPDFAARIISRYASPPSGAPNPADMLFMRARISGERENQFARSVRNIYLIHRAITENTVLNLNIHLDFLNVIFSKAVRQLHESVARHIHMLEKNTAAASNMPIVTAGFPGSAFHDAAAPILLPYRLQPNRTGRLPAVETSPRAELLLSAVPPADAIPLKHAGTPNQARVSANDIVSAGKPQTGDKPSQASKALQEKQPLKAYEKETKPHSRNAGKTILPGSRAVSPEEIPGLHGAGLQRYLLSVFGRAAESVPLWHRQLWLAERKDASVGMTLAASPRWRLPEAPRLMPNRGSVMPETDTGLRLSREKSAQAPARQGDSAHPPVLSEPVVGAPREAVSLRQTTPASMEKPRLNATPSPQQINARTERDSSVADSNRGTTQKAFDPSASQATTQLSGEVARTSAATRQDARVLLPSKAWAYESVPRRSLDLADKTGVLPNAPYGFVPAPHSAREASLRWQPEGSPLTEATAQIKSGFSADSPRVRMIPRHIPLSSPDRTDRTDASRLLSGEESGARFSGSIAVPASAVPPSAVFTDASLAHVAQGAQGAVRSSDVSPGYFPAARLTLLGTAASSASRQDKAPTGGISADAIANAVNQAAFASQTSRLPGVQRNSRFAGRFALSSPGDSYAPPLALLGAAASPAPYQEKAPTGGITADAIANAAGRAAFAPQTSRSPGVQRNSRFTGRFAPSSSGDSYAARSERLASSARQNPALPFVGAENNTVLPMHTRHGDAVTRPPVGSAVTGAPIVYRKETPERREEPPPISSRTSEDIEFIKKTVKQSSVSSRTREANVAVNLPNRDKGIAGLRDAGAPYDIDRQANAIADKVYSALERRLRSERMRKGLL